MQTSNLNQIEKALDRQGEQLSQKQQYHPIKQQKTLMRTEHPKTSTEESQQCSPAEEDLQKEQNRPPSMEVGKIRKQNKKSNCSQLVVNIADTRYPIVKKVVKNILGFKVVKDIAFTEWDLMWTDNAVQPDHLAKMKTHQKINHFPGMFTLSRKNYLARNLTKMSKEFAEEYQFYPKTWVLPSQMNELKNYMENEVNSVVIAKPEASCQGRGIFLSKSIEDFQFGEHYVVQKYMKRPFLIDSLKFDLRVYVLVVGCDPLRIYIYKEGLARFATQKYVQPKKENLGNLFMHLTNYAINKNNSKFEFNDSPTEMDKGHKRSLTSIFQKLDELGHDSQHIWRKICDIITKTLISVQPILSHHYRSCQPDNLANNMCFEVLGFDVILDEHLEPAILEVNYTPSFTTDTPLDKTIKQNLIKDSLVLMNLNNKIKNDMVNAKKKEMIQRTLTGKKVFYSKDQRAIMIKKLQKKRDQWENMNLGNFQKIFPVVDATAMQDYDKFLSYSEQSYLQVTGGNIIRNPKVINASHSISNNDGEADLLGKDRQPTKFTKTEQLQKIYMTKQKKMLPYNRKLQNSDSVKKKEEKEELVRSIPKVQLKTHASSNGRINAYKIQNKSACITQKGIVNINLAGRAESARAKQKGFSKIYNITFKEIPRHRL